MTRLIISVELSENGEPENSRGSEYDGLTEKPRTFLHVSVGRNTFGFCSQAEPAHKAGLQVGSRTPVQSNTTIQQLGVLSPLGETLRTTMNLQWVVESYWVMTSLSMTGL